MKINREALLKSLLAVKPGISANERISQSSSVIFSQGKLISYNDSYLAMVPCSLDIEGAVHAEELTSVLRKLSQEEVDITRDDAHVVVKAGPAKSGICYEDFIRLPIEQVLEDAKAAEMRDVPEGFISALKRSSFCVSSDAGRPALASIHVKGDVVEACNGYKGIRIRLQKAELPELFMPASSASVLQPYSLSRMGVSGPWLFLFGADDLLLGVRLMRPDESFPELDHLFTRDGVDIVLPEKLLDAMDKTAIFTRNHNVSETAFVTVQLKPGCCTLRGEGIFGWYEEKISAKDYQGEELSFMANPEVLVSILPHVRRAVFCNGTLLHFSGDDFQYVFACMKNKE